LRFWSKSASEDGDDELSGAAGYHSASQQSHYASDPKISAENPPANIELAKIRDLLNCNLTTFLKKH
jgi:hypothetical protein